MWKIEGNILPAADYENLSLDCIHIFDNSVDEVNKSGDVVVPYDFYDVCDAKGKTACDYLYGDYTSDEITLLSEIISKQKHVDWTCEDVTNITKRGLAFLVIHSCSFDVEPKLVIQSADDVFHVNVHYLHQCIGYSELANAIPNVFSNLLFMPDSLDPIEKIGNFQECIEEIIRHLTALNQNAGKIYRDSRDENEALLTLSAACGIVCSGKGSKEDASYKKSLEYEGRTYTLTCNPHTKLFNAHSDSRIYFSWGRREIDEHKVIIARVGDHWH